MTDQIKNLSHILRISWVGLLLLMMGCSQTAQKPDTSSGKYKQAVSDFYVSLAAVQADQALFAVKKMQAVADAYPSEPAAWANLGVYALRQGNFEVASRRISKAIDRAPDNAKIQFLAGIIKSRQGEIDSALDYFRQTVQLDSTNIKGLYALAEELERQDPKSNASEIMKLLDQILQLDPHNLAVLLEKIRTAAQMENQDKLKRSLNLLAAQSPAWPEPIEKRFQELKTQIMQKSKGNISFELAFMRNNLNQLPAFQHDLEKIRFPQNQVGFLITNFLWLPEADQQAAPKDPGLTFSPKDESNQSVQLFKPLGLAYEQQFPAIAIKGDQALLDGSTSLDFPAGNQPQPLRPQAVTVLDYNYDFRNDLAFAGPGGFKLYKQKKDSSFTEVTDSLGLPAGLLETSYIGSWTFDLDLDGDLDLLLSAEDGTARVLRNNGDGTFAAQPNFTSTQHIKDMLWADFDLDGDPDAAVLTEEGEMHYYTNHRLMTFRRDSTFSVPQPVRAITYGDLDSDGIFEILSLHNNTIRSTSFVDSTASWYYESILRTGNSAPKSPVGTPQLFIADIDNNAAMDVVLAENHSTRYWLSNEEIKLDSASAGQVPLQTYGLSDINGDQRLDFVGVGQDGQQSIQINSGSKSYNARIIRPRASGPVGDKRINSFGIGGVIESRSGLHYTRQPIDKPWVHIGLGTYKEAKMLRIIWPNGSVQAEFAELGYDSQIMNEQLLKGSCPWVMTYNGQQMEFVTDFLWRTALGLRINAQGEASAIHSIDWIKIDGDQLKPRAGRYDVRITADLWETHFFDHVSLMAVDHPAGTEVFVDERFILPAPDQKLYPMQKIYPVKAAFDQQGRDVTSKIARNDGRYVTSFPLTTYQGLAKEHYLEVELGDRKRAGGQQKLIASGWIYPTDSSINIAISQGATPAPHGIRLEVPDGEGGWKVVRQNIGFPAGKNKTMVINLGHLFEPGTERKLRLYTNMEIYWDQIRVGIQDESIPLKTKKLLADTSILRYRGFSKLVQTGRFKPTRPDYQQIATTAPQWRDLVGFYTRFGPVGELTRKIDDRYVIMNAGDELVFKFPALNPPQKGWERDFVLIGDGWVKDGDLNTGFSKTVLPLPYHGMEDYDQPPGLLRNDPVYQEHKADWVKYHTRYITPDHFNMALQFKK